MTEPVPPTTRDLIRAQAAISRGGPTSEDLAHAPAILSEAGPTSAELAAALAVLAKAGISVPAPTSDAFSAPRRAESPTCTHPDGCTNPATHQISRPATDEEAEQHWTAQEQHIRASNDGRPEAEYVADRTDTVVKAEHRCDDPAHADPAYLDALGNQGPDDA